MSNSVTPAKITFYPAGGTAGTQKIADIPRPCTHREHFAPNMVVRERGVYRHTCPGCGNSYTFTEHGPPQC
jgi:hypothetical protein